MFVFNVLETYNHGQEVAAYPCRTAEAAKNLIEQWGADQETELEWVGEWEAYAPVYETRFYIRKQQLIE